MLSFKKVKKKTKTIKNVEKYFVLLWLEIMYDFQ